MPEERSALAAFVPEAAGSPSAEDLLTLDTTVEDGCWTVAATGEVDMLSSPALRQALVTSPVPDGVDRAVLDLTGVQFMGSDGLGVVVAAHERLATAGVPLQVVVAGPVVRRPMEITGLHLLLDVVDVEERA